MNASTTPSGILRNVLKARRRDLKRIERKIARLEKSIKLRVAWERKLRSRNAFVAVEAVFNPPRARKTKARR